MSRPHTRTAGLLVCAAVTLLLALGTAGPVSGDSPVLPLGDADLPETRTSEALADGVTLTRIVRGDALAPRRKIATTTRGPWRVNVLTIDPAVATGRLMSTYGADLGQTEPVSELVASVGALAGVNASYFTFGADPAYPGNPVGLGVYDGGLLSEPELTAPAEIALLVDSRTNSIAIDKVTWQGSLRDEASGRTLTLEHLNRPPRVPDGCRKLKRPTRCTEDGDVALLSPRFATTTPAGKGVEVVLGRRGCAVRQLMQRGTVLKPWQSAVQATGRQTRRLLKVTADRSCPTRTSVLTDSAGSPIELGPWLSAMNGRFRLTMDGRRLLHRGPEGFYTRHPRTFVGRTETGAVMLVTIDGRQRSSVGATLVEASAVAKALGLTDSVNLDGGGSTTMVVNGALVNTPSGSAERAVGDALVYVPAPAPSP
jgi:exopolysaccharide biosynthesis protein